MSGGEAGAGRSGGKPRFFFVRHGETDWNRTGRLQGQHDVPLNAKGRDQALATGRTLARLVSRRGLEVTGLDFVASPLGRTRATMELLRQAIGLPTLMYRTEVVLREISFGRWEGSTWAEIKLADPKGFAERKRDKWIYVPPDGESYADLVQRLSPWLESLRDDAVVVSHGGVARAMLTLLAGVGTAAAPAVEIHQGRVLAFCEGRATWH